MSYFYIMENHLSLTINVFLLSHCVQILPKFVRLNNHMWCIYITEQKYVKCFTRALIEYLVCIKNTPS